MKDNSARTRSASLPSSAADLSKMLLPCPICKGVEGCDHTVPERLAAFVNLHGELVEALRKIAGGMVSKDICEKLDEDESHVPSLDRFIVELQDLARSALSKAESK